MNLLEIKQYLTENNITLPITIGSSKDADSIGLFTTGGQRPTFYFDDTMSIYEGLQIIVRHISYLECENTIKGIFSLLNKLEGFEPQQNPFSLGRNEKGYMEFSINYIITKEGAK